MRWHMFGRAAWSYSMMKSVRHVGVSGLLQASEHQDILWELRPNLDTLYKLKPFKTNSVGLRDQEYPLTKPAQTFRIAVIGDSYTMGEGVAIDEVYHSRIEKKLNEEHDGRAYELINFGVAGYSLPQYLATIDHRVLPYHPDLILIGFCAANDSKKPNLEAFKQPYMVKPLGNGFLQMYFFEHIGNVYKNLYKYIRNRYPGYNADGPYLEGEFEKIAKLTAAHGIPVAIAYIDNRAASADFNMIREAAAKHHFEFIDGTTGFSPQLSPDHIIYLTDGHPNGKANAIIADALYDGLKQVISRLH